MSRGLVGAGVGAAGATLYLKPEFVQDYAKNLIFGPRAVPGLPPAVGKELEQLQRLVEDLSRQVSASGKPQPVTVVHTSTHSDRAGTYLLYGCTAAGLGAVLYFRVLRGWTFGDMLYATRRGLRDGLAQVSTGLEQLGARVQEVKARLQERIAALARKQDEMLGAQAEMRAALAGVGRDVEYTRGQVGQVHAVVMDLEAGMAEVGANQRHANHGIYVLCKAVSELMAGSNIPSKAELIEYTQQHPVWAASGERLQGLESLLPAGGAAPGLRRAASSATRTRDDSSTGTELRGPFLLPVARGSSGGSEDVPRKSSTGGSEGFGAAPAVGPAGASQAPPFTHPFQQQAFVPVAYPTSVSVGGAGDTQSSMYVGDDW